MPPAEQLNVPPEVHTSATHQTDREQLMPWGPRLFAVSILALAAWIVIQGLTIPEPTSYSAVGPKVFPLFVGALLSALGIIFLIQTTIRPDPFLAKVAKREGEAAEWRLVVMMVAALLTYVFLLDHVGYVVSTLLLFPITARILGSRRILRDSITSVVLVLTVYFAFTRLLGVNLPAGAFL